MGVETIALIEVQALGDEWQNTIRYLLYIVRIVSLFGVLYIPLNSNAIISLSGGIQIVR